MNGSRINCYRCCFNIPRWLAIAMAAARESTQFTVDVRGGLTVRSEMPRCAAISCAFAAGDGFKHLAAQRSVRPDRFRRGCPRMEGARLRAERRRVMISGSEEVSPRAAARMASNKVDLYPYPSAGSRGGTCLQTAEHELILVEGVR